MRCCSAARTLGRSSSGSAGASATSRTSRRRPSSRRRPTTRRRRSSSRTSPTRTTRPPWHGPRSRTPSTARGAAGSRCAWRSGRSRPPRWRYDVTMIARYTRPEMKELWSDEAKYHAWLRVELAATEALARRGLVPRDDLATIREKAAFDVARIAAIEADVKHDVIAFVTSVAEKIGPAGRHVHY